MLLPSHNITLSLLSGVWLKGVPVIILVSSSFSAACLAPHNADVWCQQCPDVQNLPPTLDDNRSSLHRWVDLSFFQWTDGVEDGVCPWSSACGQTLLNPTLIEAKKAWIEEQRKWHGVPISRKQQQCFILRIWSSRICYSCHSDQICWNYDRIMDQEKLIWRLSERARMMNGTVVPGQVFDCHSLRHQKRWKGERKKKKKEESQVVFMLISWAINAMYARHKLRTCAYNNIMFPLIFRILIYISSKTFI